MKNNAEKPTKLIINIVLGKGTLSQKTSFRKLQQLLVGEVKSEGKHDGR
jgi:hypothetical protein